MFGPPVSSTPNGFGGNPTPTNNIFSQSQQQSQSTPFTFGATSQQNSQNQSTNLFGQNGAQNSGSGQGMFGSGAMPSSSGFSFTSGASNPFSNLGTAAQQGASTSVPAFAGFGQPQKAQGFQFTPFNAGGGSEMQISPPPSPDKGSTSTPTNLFGQVPTVGTPAPSSLFSFGQNSTSAAVSLALSPCWS